ncbi:MAG: efflux RND transporter periplasmic adaptor subunit [Proteobacteria bacterium]|nr:efflux RND transporter periplasmic adaptor subunit [Pseudomonadota bacterium]
MSDLVHHSFRLSSQPVLRRWFAVLAMSAALLVVGGIAAAHEGHDHEEEPATAVLPPGNSTRAVAELTSELYEALIQSHGDHLDIYLDRFDTNEPVVGATLTLSVDEREAAASVEESPGQYRIDIEPVAAGAVVALTLIVSAPAGEDLLGGTLEIPTADDSGDGSMASVPWLLIVALLGGALLVWLAWRAVRARAARGTDGYAASISGRVSSMLLAGVAASLAALVAPPSAAHEGHDHAEEAAPAVAVGDSSRPARLADGSLFVPKATQRILALRTQRASNGATSVAMRLAGEIVGDPRASASLQTLQGGRVAGIGDAWPVLGARVKRGQPLLRLTPSGSGGERAATAADAARVTAELAQARVELARLEGLPGIVSRAEVDAARANVRSLVAQRAALTGTARGGEVIAAPLDGVVASIATSPGVVASPGETLLTIIDPARLSIEALAFQSLVSADIVSATVALPTGKTVAARVVGVGMQLQGGAIPVRLNLAEIAAGINVGTPVVVFLELAEQREGVSLPLESLVRTAQGDRVVFEKVSAERFMPRTVRVRPISADRVAVLDGLASDVRIVTSGAALLSQIR